MNDRTRASLTVLAAITLLSCALPTSVLQLIAPPAPTLDELTLNLYVAQTAAAAATQTSLAAPSPYRSPTLVPTFTPIVSTTPSPVPSLTPTFIFQVASPTVPKPTATRTATRAPSTSTANTKFACEFIAQEPDNGEVFDPNEDFDARWRVKNIGTRTWEENGSDYLYKSGDKIHKQAAYDFPKTVAPGKSVDLIVDMRAPTDPGTYTTRWEIRIGSNRFCTMRLTIEVD
jgi:hypothetical protein